MAIFNSFVKLPEGTFLFFLQVPFDEVVDLVRYEGARRALEMKLGSLQLDVHDNSAGWRSLLA